MTATIEDGLLAKALLRDCTVDLSALEFDAPTMSDIQQAGVLLFVSMDRIDWRQLGEHECCRLVHLVLNSAGALRHHWYPLARRFPDSYVATCAVVEAHSSCYEPVRLGTMQDILYNYAVMALADASDPRSRHAELLRTVWVDRPEGAIAREYLLRYEPHIRSGP